MSVFIFISLVGGLVLVLVLWFALTLLVVDTVLKYFDERYNDT